MAKSVLVLRSSPLHKSDNLTNISVNLNGSLMFDRLVCHFKGFRVGQCIYHEPTKFPDDGKDRDIIGTFCDNSCRSVLELCNLLIALIPVTPISGNRI